MLKSPRREEGKSEQKVGETEGKNIREEGKEWEKKEGENCIGIE